MLDDTIASISTGLTSAGIGIIRVSGNESISIVNTMFKSNKKNKKLKDVPSHTIHYGKFIDPSNNEIIDEVLVSVMKSPNTYTREDIVEINCHGGIIVIQNILNILLKNGIRLAEPGEFTKRAFLNGRIDLTQAEAVMDIINSKTELALKSSVNQLSGSISNEVKMVKNKLLEIIAHVEASIDYPEYDIQELTNENLLLDINDIRKPIINLIKSFDYGKIIKDGIKTAIIGKPNVGKSSLLNALLKEQRAIVTDIPGTTRDILEEYINIHGIPLKLIDTAGIRETDDVVENLGVNKAKEIISEADLIILMFDASKNLTDEDKKIVELVKNKKTIVLLNKTDLPIKINKKEIYDIFDEDIVLITSIKKLEGIDMLEDKIKDMFTLGDINISGQVYITNVRQKNALYNCLKSLDEVEKGIKAEMPIDLIAIDLKNAYDYIGELTGDSVNEDVVEQIFSQFCLGK